MPVANRTTLTASGCSTTVPVDITLNEAAGIDFKDTKFNLIIIPEGAGTGTVSLSWACGQFPTVFATARDANGVAITASMADAVTVIEISDIDLYVLRLTPSAFSGVTGYKYSLTPIGT